MTGRRACARCLLRDLAESDFGKRTELEMIKKYRDAISAGDRAAEKEYEARLAVCGDCDRLLDGTCASCGCYVELRAAARHSHCPRKKW